MALAQFGQETCVVVVVGGEDGAQGGAADCRHSCAQVVLSQRRCACASTRSSHAQRSLALR
jgi:hypothetical protein